MENLFTCQILIYPSQILGFSRLRLSVQSHPCIIQVPYLNKCKVHIYLYLLFQTESKVDFPVKRPEAPSRQAEVDFLDLFMDDDDDDGGGDGEDSTPGDGK